MKAKLKKLMKIRKPSKHFLWSFFEGSKRIIESEDLPQKKLDDLQFIIACVKRSIKKPKRKKE